MRYLTGGKPTAPEVVREQYLKIYAGTMFVNRGSRNVMEKLGMTHVKTYFPELEPIEGSEHGEVRYELTVAEWAGR